MYIQLTERLVGQNKNLPQVNKFFLWMRNFIKLNWMFVLNPEITTKTEKTGIKKTKKICEKLKKTVT